jgi:phage shock protein A
MTKVTDLLGGPPADWSVHVGRAEGALARLVARMANELVEAKDQVAAAKREGMRLAKQADVASRVAEQWDKRARAAVRAGDDVVAKDALVRRRECEQAAQAFRAAGDKQREEVERLTAVLSDRSLRLEEAKHRKSAVLTRARHAKAESSLDAATDDSAASVFELLERLETALAALERDAAIASELSDESIANARSGATDARALEADFLVVKKLAKARAIPPKPLAKTNAASSAEGERARSASSRVRRNKR